MRQRSPAKIGRGYISTLIALTASLLQSDGTTTWATDCFERDANKLPQVLITEGDAEEYDALTSIVANDEFIISGGLFVSTSTTIAPSFGQVLVTRFDLDLHTRRWARVLSFKDTSPKLAFFVKAMALKEGDGSKVVILSGVSHSDTQNMTFMYGSTFTYISVLQTEDGSLTNKTLRLRNDSDNGSWWRTTDKAIHFGSGEKVAIVFDLDPYGGQPAILLDQTLGLRIGPQQDRTVFYFAEIDTVSGQVQRAQSSRAHLGRLTSLTYIESNQYQYTLAGAVSNENSDQFYPAWFQLDSQSNGSSNIFAYDFSFASKSSDYPVIEYFFQPEQDVYIGTMRSKDLSNKRTEKFAWKHDPYSLTAWELPSSCDTHIEAVKLTQTLAGYQIHMVIVYPEFAGGYATTQYGKLDFDTNKYQYQLLINDGQKDYFSGVFAGSRINSLGAPDSMSVYESYLVGYTDKLLLKSSQEYQRPNANPIGIMMPTLIDTDTCSYNTTLSGSEKVLASTTMSLQTLQSVVPSWDYIYNNLSEAEVAAYDVLMHKLKANTLVCDSQVSVDSIQTSDGVQNGKVCGVPHTDGRETLVPFTMPSYSVDSASTCSAETDQRKVWIASIEALNPTNYDGFNLKTSVTLEEDSLGQNQGAIRLSAIADSNSPQNYAVLRVHLSLADNFHRTSFDLVISRYHEEYNYCEIQRYSYTAEELAWTYILGSGQQTLQALDSVNWDCPGGYTLSVAYQAADNSALSLDWISPHQVQGKEIAINLNSDSLDNMGTYLVTSNLYADCYNEPITFTLEVKPSCTYVTLDASPLRPGSVQNLFVDVNEPTVEQTIEFDLDLITVTFPNGADSIDCPPLELKFAIPDETILSTNSVPLKISETNPNFILLSENATWQDHLKTYQVSLTAKYEGYDTPTSTTTFEVQLLAACTNIQPKEAPLPDQEYTVGSPMLEIPITTFNAVPTHPQCLIVVDIDPQLIVSYDLDPVSQVRLNTLTGFQIPMPSQLGYNGSTNSVIIEELSNMDLTLTEAPYLRYYDIPIKAYSIANPASTRTETFTITVRNPCVDPDLAFFTVVAEQTGYYEYAVNAETLKAPLEASFQFSLAASMCGTFRTEVLGAVDPLSFQSSSTEFQIYSEDTDLVDTKVEVEIKARLTDYPQVESASQSVAFKIIAAPFAVENTQPFLDQSMQGDLTIAWAELTHEESLQIVRVVPLAKPVDAEGDTLEVILTEPSQEWLSLRVNSESVVEVALNEWQAVPGSYKVQFSVQETKTDQGEVTLSDYKFTLMVEPPIGEDQQDAEETSQSEDQAASGGTEEGSQDDQESGTQQSSGHSDLTVDLSSYGQYEPAQPTRIPLEPPKEPEIDPPSFKIVSMDSFGLVVLEFSDLLLKIESPATQINPGTLSVSLDPSNDAMTPLLSFSWEFLGLVGKQISLQLYFENAIFVSSDNSGPDVLQVDILSPELFVSARSFKQVEETSSSLDAPLQNYQADKDQIQSLKSTAQTLQEGGNMIAGANIVINTLLAGSLAVLWGLVNSLQIVAYMKLFASVMPTNALIYYDLAYFLATFKIIPTAEILEFLNENVISEVPTDNLSRRLADENQNENQEEEQLAEQPQEETEATIDIEQDKEPSFLEDVLILIMMFAALIAFVVILGLCACCIGRCKKGRICLRKVWNKVFWNGPIRSLLEMSLKTFIRCLTSFYVLSFATSYDSFQAIFVLATFCLLVLLAVYYPICLYRRRDQLDSERFKAKYGSLVLKLNVSKTSTIFFQTVFTARRLVLAVLIVCCASKPWLQLVLTTVACLVQAAFIAHFKPFEARWMNRLELHNEFLIMCSVYCFFIYSDAMLLMQNPGYPEYDEGISDIATKNTMSWGQVGIVGLMCAVNILVMLLIQCGTVLDRCKTCYRKRQAKSQALAKQSNLLLIQAPEAQRPQQLQLQDLTVDVTNLSKTVEEQSSQDLTKSVGKQGPNQASIEQPSAPPSEPEHAQYIDSSTSSEEENANVPLPKKLIQQAQAEQPSAPPSEPEHAQYIDSSTSSEEENANVPLPKKLIQQAQAEQPSAPPSEPEHAQYIDSSTSSEEENAYVPFPKKVIHQAQAAIVTRPLLVSYDAPPKAGEVQDEPPKPLQLRMMSKPFERCRGRQLGIERTRRLREEKEAAEAALRQRRLAELTEMAQASQASEARQVIAPDQRDSTPHQDAAVNEAYDPDQYELV